MTQEKSFQEKRASFHGLPTHFIHLTLDYLGRQDEHFGMDCHKGENNVVGRSHSPIASSRFSGQYHLGGISIEPDTAFYSLRDYEFLFEYQHVYVDGDLGSVHIRQFKTLKQIWDEILILNLQALVTDTQVEVKFENRYEVYRVPCCCFIQGNDCMNIEMNQDMIDLQEAIAKSKIGMLLGLDSEMWFSIEKLGSSFIVTKQSIDKLNGLEMECRGRSFKLQREHSLKVPSGVTEQDQKETAHLTLGSSIPKWQFICKYFQTISQITISIDKLKELSLVIQSYTPLQKIILLEGYQSSSFEEEFKLLSKNVTISEIDIVLFSPSIMKTFSNYIHQAKNINVITIRGDLVTTRTFLSQIENNCYTLELIQIILTEQLNNIILLDTLFMIEKKAPASTILHLSQVLYSSDEAELYISVLIQKKNQRLLSGTNSIIHKDYMASHIVTFVKGFEGILQTALYQIEESYPQKHCLHFIEFGSSFFSKYLEFISQVRERTNFQSLLILQDDYEYASQQLNIAFREILISFKGALLIAEVKSVTF